MNYFVATGNPVCSKCPLSSVSILFGNVLKMYTQMPEKVFQFLTLTSFNIQFGSSIRVTVRATFQAAFASECFDNHSRSSTWGIRMKQLAYITVFSSATELAAISAIFAEYCHLCKWNWVLLGNFLMIFRKVHRLLGMQQTAYFISNSDLRAKLYLKRNS